MLAQITERAFMEHQLAARHFTFYNFCEHAPLCVRARVCAFVCVCVCVYPLDRPNRPDCDTLRETAPLCRVVLCPVERSDRCHVHLGVHRWRR